MQILKEQENRRINKFCFLGSRDLPARKGEKEHDEEKSLKFKEVFVLYCKVKTIYLGVLFLVENSGLQTRISHVIRLQHVVKKMGKRKQAATQQLEC